MVIQTRDDWKADSDALLVDNVSGDIEANQLNTLVKNLADSALFRSNVGSMIAVSYALTSNYTASTPNVVYDAQGLPNNTRTFTINQRSQWTDLGAANLTIRFQVRNSSSTYWLKVLNHASNGNFANMDHDEFWIQPNEVREFLITDNGTTMQVEPVGPISYTFRANSPDLSGAVWTITDSRNMPSEIMVTPSSGNADRIEFKMPCILKHLRLSMEWGFTGTPASGFGQLAVLKPAARLMRSGAQVEYAHEALVENLLDYVGETHHEFAFVTLTANQYIHFRDNGVTKVEGVILNLFGEMVLKEA